MIIECTGQETKLSWDSTTTRSASLDFMLIPLLGSKKDECALFSTILQSTTFQLIYVIRSTPLDHKILFFTTLLHFCGLQWHRAMTSATIVIHSFRGLNQNGRLRSCYQMLLHISLIGPIPLRSKCKRCLRKKKRHITWFHYQTLT